jgi:hypothetical protein
MGASIEQEASMAVVQEIQESLAGLKLGSPQSHVNLAVFPLLGESAVSNNYLLLDEALERKLARVTEVSAEGRVPELAFENGSCEKILLVDGDELVGAKQNRILNLSILVGGGQKLVIPVSCVEQGRWSWRGGEFRAARRTMFAKARARKTRHVTESLRFNGDRRSNQSDVWAGIAAKVQFCAVQSDTLAMADVYDETAPRLRAYGDAFGPELDQRGAVIAIDGKPIGVELFDSAAAFARYLPKLVASYALDAIETECGKSFVPSEDDVRRFLESIANAAGERVAALGEGEDIRLSGEGISAGALAANGRLVHLAGFAMA